MTELVGDLQVEQDTTFEKREWNFQRVGRVLMSLIVVAALLGFFGAGPLSLTEVRDDTGNLSLAYEHFGRRGSTTELVVDVAPAAIANGKAEVWLSSHYLGEMQVESVTPAPDQVTIQDDGYVYTFLVDQPEDAVTATFTFTIDAMGTVTGHAGLAGAEPIELDHFFTP
ncbi:MAG TPA: hypothetical protein VG929_06470 [Actinomycetota bacterium]|nr:hypothetical protein [Actinomycetota bacterium]